MATHEGKLDASDDEYKRNQVPIDIFNLEVFVKCSAVVLIRRDLH